MLVEVMFVVAPSPKLHVRFVIVPVEVSVNVTLNGTTPLVGVAVKLADGTKPPTPVMLLVESPPLSEVKMTAFVKLPAATGANCTTTLVEPPAGTSNVLPDTIEYGPPVTVAVP